VAFVLPPTGGDPPSGLPALELAGALGAIAITFGVAITSAYFGLRDVCGMSTIIKLPAARDQRSVGARKSHYTRGATKCIRWSSRARRPARRFSECKKKKGEEQERERRTFISAIVSGNGPTLSRRPP